MREHIFFSKTENLRLVRRPKLVTADAYGTQKVEHPGERVEFDAGFFRTKDQGVVEWLQAHPSNGVRFVELETEPQAPEPQPDVQRVIELAAQGDRHALETLHRDEEAGWHRPAVLEAAQNALEALKPRPGRPKAAA